MKINKNIQIILAVVLILLALFFITKRFYSGEDGWIREKDGMWVQHGEPKTIPKEVADQYDALLCGFGFYSYYVNHNITLNSQCLGRCGEYAIDVVNVPRNSDDDKKENQCPDYINGTVSKYIEIDKDSNIVRIID